MESWLLMMQAELLSIYAEIEGMKAENQYRINRGETIAYSEKSFMEKSEQVLGIRNYIQQNR